MCVCVCGHMCFVSLYLSVHVFVCEKVGVCVGGGGDGGGGTQGCACVTHRAIPNASVTHMHTHIHTHVHDCPIHHVLHIEQYQMHQSHTHTCLSHSL